MELKINEERENPLFDRREIIGLIKSEKTPSRQEILKLLSLKYSVFAENIKIKKIKGKFGTKIFKIEANIYSSKKKKDEIELKKKKEIELEKKILEPEKTDQQSKKIELQKDQEEKIKEDIVEKNKQKE